MTEFISNLVGNSELATVIMSIFPLIELKGGIVFARSAGLDFILSFLLAFVGSTIVFFPIYFLLKPILNLMKKIKWFNKLATKVEGYFTDKAEKTLESQTNKNLEKGKSRNSTFLKQLGVLIFVAIPLPMTGVWTGTAISVFLNLKFKHAILPVVIGNFIAGLLISLLCLVCLTFWSIEVLDYILYGLFFIVIFFLFITIIKVVTNKTNKQ